MTFAALLVIQKRDRTSGDRSRPTSLGKEVLLFGTLGHAKVHLRPLVVKKKKSDKETKKESRRLSFLLLNNLSFSGISRHDEEKAEQLHE